MNFDFKYFQLKHPFTCIVAGTTLCGKTVFVRQLLQQSNIMNKNLKHKPKVLWVYGQWQPVYSNPVGNVDVEYTDGLLPLQSMLSQSADVVVVDDLMRELGGNLGLSNFFRKISHHFNISVIYIVQNVFHQAKQMRNISLNAHYSILFKNARDGSQILHLARQLYPTKINFLIEALMDATQKPFGYIKIHNTMSQPDNLRIQGNNFPLNDQFEITVYTEKNVGKFAKNNHDSGSDIPNKEKKAERWRFKGFEEQYIFI